MYDTTRISISFDTFINHYKVPTTIRDIRMYLFFYTWGNPRGHPVALLESGGLVSDLSTKTPRWPAWCSTGFPPGPLSNCCRSTPASSSILREPFLRNLDIERGHPQWAVVQIRGDPRTSSARRPLYPRREAQRRLPTRNPTIVRGSHPLSLCPVL